MRPAQPNAKSPRRPRQRARALVVLPGNASGRAAQKRQAIASAAAELFAIHGYSATSVDRIADDARVSKQTVYEYFGSKEQLFLAVMAAAEDTVLTGLAESLAPSIEDPVDLERELVSLGKIYLRGVLDPDLMALRRLVIGEVPRFPQLARAWHEAGPGRANSQLAARFQDLTQQGLLKADDPLLAANHFSWLVLGMPQNMILFGVVDRFSDAELDNFAQAAARVFMAAYRADAGGRDDNSYSLGDQ